MQNQINFILNAKQKEKDEIFSLEPNKVSVLLKNGIETVDGTMYEYKMDNIASVVKRDGDWNLTLIDKFLEAKVEHNLRRNEFPDAYSNVKGVRIVVLNDQT